MMQFHLQHWQQYKYSFHLHTDVICRGHLQFQHSSYHLHRFDLIMALSAKDVLLGQLLFFVKKVSENILQYNSPE